MAEKWQKLRNLVKIWPKKAYILGFRQIFDNPSDKVVEANTKKLVVRGILKILPKSQDVSFFRANCYQIS